MNQTVQDAINEQINAELTASYAYLAMSAYCEQQSFVGCARWLRAQSQEEYGHGMKLFDFMLARNGRIQLKPMGEPPAKFSSVVDVFERAYQQEQEVSRQIDQLYDLAFREKAFAATVELEWFLMEQVEEEKTAREIVRKLHLIKNDPASLLDLDRELGARSAGVSTPMP